MYDTFELKTDEDVFQMLECKSFFPLNTMIELYVTITRSVEEILSLLTRNTHPHPQTPSQLHQQLFIMVDLSESIWFRS